jgi:hypothetical protein
LRKAENTANDSVAVYIERNTAVFTRRPAVLWSVFRAALRTEVRRGCAR